MAFSFSADFDGSTIESAIMFMSGSLSAVVVVAVDERFAKIVDELVEGFVVADKKFCTS